MMANPQLLNKKLPEGMVYSVPPGFLLRKTLVFVLLLLSGLFHNVRAQLKLDTVVYLNFPDIDFFYDVVLYLSLAEKDSGQLQIIDSKGEQLTFLELDSFYRIIREYRPDKKMEKHWVNPYVSDHFYVGGSLLLHQSSKVLVDWENNLYTQLPITYENKEYRDTLWLYAQHEDREEFYQYAGGNLDTLLYRMNPDMLLNGFSAKHSYAVNSRYIALKRPLEYKIHLYDRQMNLIDSIFLQKKGWKPYESLERGHVMDDKMYLYALANKNKGKHSIINITFIQDSFLLVFYSYKEYKGKAPYCYFYYDVWKVGTARPILLKEGIKDVFPGKDDEIITAYKLPLVKALHKYFILNDKLIFLAYTDDIYPIGLSFEEREKKRIDFYENRDPVVSLWVFSLELPEGEGQ